MFYACNRACQIATFVKPAETYPPIKLIDEQIIFASPRWSRNGAPVEFYLREIFESRRQVWIRVDYTRGYLSIRRSFRNARFPYERKCSLEFDLSSGAIKIFVKMREFPYEVLWAESMFVLVHCWNIFIVVIYTGWSI